MYKRNEPPRADKIPSAALIFILLSPGAAIGNMTVYPMELNIDSAGAAQINVTSKSDDIQFIKVSQKKILSPGTPEENEVDIQAWKDGGIVTTPAKFVLAAGTNRKVRLVSLMAPEKETTWRVYFEGVKQPENFTPGAEPKSQAMAQLGVNIVWGALVHLAPKSPVISLSISQQSGELVNSGTLRVPMREIGICQSANQCRWVKEESTIYPDTRRKLKTLKMEPGATYKIRYFNWLKKAAEVADVPVV